MVNMRVYLCECTMSMKIVAEAKERHCIETGLMGRRKEPDPS